VVPRFRHFGVYVDQLKCLLQECTKDPVALHLECGISYLFIHKRSMTRQSLQKLTLFVLNSNTM
jgi:hypothetical protein